MSRAFRAFIAAAVLLLAGGCGAAFNPPPRPAAVSHMNVANKQAHIDSAKATLKIFQASAQDLRTRDKPFDQQRLAEEVKRFIRLQVKPIVEDFEAGNTLQTRLEIAKLQLLSGLVYLELDEQWQLNKVLRDMERRYADQPDVFSAAIDRRDVGFGTIGDGMRSLEERRYGAARVRP